MKNGNRSTRFSPKWYGILYLLIQITLPQHVLTQPIQLHPENPHYFLYRGKPTVLVTSGEHYGAVLNLDFDYKEYLQTLQQDGLNQTRLFSGMYVETWGEGWNMLNPAHGRYIAPWARSDTPGYADGGNKFDLSRWDNDYFARLRDFVATSERYGIIVEVVLFCVFYNDDEWNISPLNTRNNINGIGNRGRHAVYDESDPEMMAIQEAMVRKIVGELKRFENVYFELCNEPYWDEGPKIGSPWNDRIVSVIQSESSDHLIALNVANDSALVELVPDGIDILNFHYARPPNAVAMNYQHNKPIGFDESGFKGPEDSPYRRFGWDFMIAGGAVFSNLDWSFTVDSEIGTSTEAEDRLGGGSPSLRKQIGYLKRFMDSLDFINMAPTNAVIKGGVPEDASARALVSESKTYAVYLNGGNQADLIIALEPGTYEVEWLNTKTGIIDKKEQIRAGDNPIKLSSPAYEEDIALKISRQ